MGKGDKKGSGGRVGGARLIGEQVRGPYKRIMKLIK